jgi:pimeloyl-ACP methyl ester carboxylesterase
MPAACDPGFRAGLAGRGSDAAGRQTARIAVPTLVADGASDQLDTVANDRTLVRTIRGATLVLYPDAGHAFLFQDWTRFAALANSFLAGHQSP